ncbi:MAG: PAS domain S-box protein [Candidatus Krumholzibacteriota bacterium]|nr:PAS domain S-box protein [Candidatus Krumholzibacteriota bacterium]
MSDQSNTHHKQVKEITALEERIRQLEAIEAEYLRAEKALAHSEKKFRKLFNAVTDAVMLLDENGFFDCNKAALSIFGCRTREEFLLKSPADLSPVEQPDGTDSQVLANRMISTAVEKGSFHFEWMHKRNDTGETFPADVLLTAMELDGKPIVHAVVRDITERHKVEKALRESEAKFKTYMEKAPLGIFVADNTGRYLEVNPAACRMTGYTKEELLNLTIPDFLAPEFLDKGMALFKNLKTEGYENSDYIVRKKNGEKFWINLVAASITDNRFIGFCQDITESKQAKAKIRQMAYHDSLTGLPNRKLFSDRADIALAQAERNQKNVAFIMLDLDNFKDVYDTFLLYIGGSFRLFERRGRLRMNVCDFRRGCIMARKKMK